MHSLRIVLPARDALEALLWGIWEPQGGVATEGGKEGVPVPINHAAGPGGTASGLVLLVREVPVSCYRTVGWQAAGAVEPVLR